MGKPFSYSHIKLIHCLKCILCILWWNIALIKRKECHAFIFAVLNFTTLKYLYPILFAFIKNNFFMLSNGWIKCNISCFHVKICIKWRPLPLLLCLWFPVQCNESNIWLQFICLIWFLVPSGFLDTKSVCAEINLLICS